MATLSTNRDRYFELMKNPLLFLHKIDDSYYDSQSNHRVEKIFWQSIDNDFQEAIHYNEINGNYLGYALVVAEPIKESELQNKQIDTVSFNVHAVNAFNLDDWRLVINSFIIRSQNPNDNYPFIHLLWMLNNCQWSSEIIINALYMYDVLTQPFVINNALLRISRCLSVAKQQLMKNALMHFNCNYPIYSPLFIKEALDRISPLPKGFVDNTDIFCLVNVILESQCNDEGPILRSIDEQIQNPFLRLYHWLNNDDTTFDYSYLNSIYSLSSHKIQMSIVKRYFHDIRLGKTTLDTDILEQFKNSKYSEFIRYRYCLYSPDEPINLSVPLLCDCILTSHQTGGKSFQSFDGVLDFVITHCDVTRPSVKLGMEEFLPQCNGGAVYNRQFCGFIDYEIVFELDESKFTKENLLGSIRTLLNANSRHKTYHACGYDEGKQPLSEEMLQHCLSTRCVEENTPNGIYQREVRRFECSIVCQYENKWVVYDTDYNWLNSFLKEPMPRVDSSHHPNETHIIDIEQTSTENMCKYIRSLLGVCKKIDEKRFSIGSGALKQMSLLVHYSKPLTMRIKPQSLPVVGWDFDIFGIKRALCEEKNASPQNAPEIVKEEFKTKESLELRKRVVETLMEEFHLKEFNGYFFEVPYDKELLRKLIDLYYFKGSIPDNPKKWQIEFLTRLNLKNFKPFCAPKLSDEHNKATGLPYFWCQGLECFHNCLENQTLEKCAAWHKYSLYHLIEIIGYPMLKKTEAGLEPNDPVKEFIACANRAMKKFRRLKCRTCGHLMYTHKGGGINLHNYYSCINPTCPEHNHPVYLSYCFKCKTGLIDSRDSARCPNGWYICPRCQSCCDDSLYERQAQRYTLQKKPVPFRVSSKLGQGHNDKGIHFCHICGNLLIVNGNQFTCEKCGKVYNANT